MFPIVLEKSDYKRNDLKTKSVSVFLLIFTIFIIVLGGKRFDAFF